MLRLASRTLGSGLAKSLAVPSVLFRASTRATIPTRSVLASLTSYPTRQSLVSTYTYFEGFVNGVAFDFGHIEDALMQWSKALTSFFMKDVTMRKIKPPKRIIILSFSSREKADEILRQTFYLEGTPVPLEKVIQWGAPVLPVHLRDLPGGNLDSLQDKIVGILEPIGHIIYFQFNRCDSDPNTFEASAILLFDISDQVDLPSKLPPYIEVMGAKVRLGWRDAPKDDFDQE